MRKNLLVAIAFVLTIIMSLAACGGNSGGTSGGGNVDDEINKDQQITLKIQSAAPLKQNYRALLLDTDPQDSIYKQATFTKFLVEEFKKLYPNIKLNFIEDGWGDALYEKSSLYIRDWTAGGAIAVDIMIGESYMGYFSQNKVFTALNETNFTDVLPGAYGDMVVDGKMYGVPMCTGIIGLQYNENILREAGISEDKYAPKTWAELLQNSKEVFEYAEENSKDYGGIILNNVSGLSGAFRALPFMRQAGGDFLDNNGNVALNSQANIKAFTFLRELAAYTPTGSLNETSEDTLQSLFLIQKKSAYYVDGQWAMVAAGDGIKSAALPLESKSSTITGNTFIGNVLFGITEGSKNKAAASAFLKFLTSAEVQLKLYELDGRLPVNTKVLESAQIKEINPAINPYIDMLLAGGFSGGLPHFPSNSTEIWERWGSFYKSVLTGSENISSLTASLETKLKSLVK